jgi:hypothetical protein
MTKVCNPNIKNKEAAKKELGRLTAAEVCVTGCLFALMPSGYI